MAPGVKIKWMAASTVCLTDNTAKENILELETLDNLTSNSYRAKNDDLTATLIRSMVKRTLEVDNEQYYLELIDLLPDSDHGTRITGTFDVSVALAERKGDKESINVILRGSLTDDNGYTPSFSMFYSVRQGEAQAPSVSVDISSNIQTGRISISSRSATLDLQNSVFSFRLYHSSNDEESRPVCDGRGFLVFENLMPISDNRNMPVWRKMITN